MKTLNYSSTGGKALRQGQGPRPGRVRFDWRAFIALEGAKETRCIRRVFAVYHVTHHGPRRMEAAVWRARFAAAYARTKQQPFPAGATRPWVAKLECLS